MHWQIVGTLLLVVSTSAKPFLPMPCTNGSISWNSTGSWNTTRSWNATKPHSLGNPSTKMNPPTNSTLVSSLLTADSTASRFRQLQEAIQEGTASTVFDFNPSANPHQNVSVGGQAVVADRKAFPLVTDLGIAGAVYFFAPCGLNTPHTHPRGTEIFTVSTNSTINVGFVLENGFAQQVNSTLTQYQGTAFPQGSIHWQQNMNCEPAVAIGALSSDDPGTSSLAQNFLVNTSEDVVQATLGYPRQITAENFANFRNMIHPSFVAGITECYRRCEIEC